MWGQWDLGVSTGKGALPTAATIWPLASGASVLLVCTGALRGSRPRELILVAGAGVTVCGAARGSTGLGTAAERGLRNAGAEKGLVTAAMTGRSKLGVVAGRAGAEWGVAFWVRKLAAARFAATSFEGAACFCELGIGPAGRACAEAASVLPTTGTNAWSGLPTAATGYGW